MSLEKIINEINNGTIKVIDIIKPSLAKQPKIATAVEAGKDKIINSLTALALNAKVGVLPQKYENVLMTKASQAALDYLKVSNPKKYNLIMQIFTNTFNDSSSKVNSETIDSFIRELINIDDTATLEKALESKVKIILQANSNRADYANDVKTIFLSEKRINSLAHELGHAFDQNTPVTSNPVLRASFIPQLKKNPDGTYTCTGLLTNAKQRVLATDQQGKAILVNGKPYTRVVSVISDYASTSEEFNTAFHKDCMKLLEIDEQKGLKKGTAFKNLLLDWNPKSQFGYYLGAQQKGSTKINKYNQQRELFAQLAALSTNGHTSRPDFDKKALEYFPNTFNFVDSLIKSGK